jgi:hypothetical protein
VFEKISFFKFFKIKIRGKLITLRKAAERAKITGDMIFIIKYSYVIYCYGKTTKLDHLVSFMCFVPCIVMHYQIKHQQNTHVFCISFHASTCFGPSEPSSGCLLLQNICHNVHAQYTSTYNSMEWGHAHRYTVHIRHFNKCEILIFLTYCALTPYYYKCLCVGNARYDKYSVTKGTLKMVQWGRNM